MIKNKANEEKIGIGRGKYMIVGLEMRNGKRWGRKKRKKQERRGWR